MGARGLSDRSDGSDGLGWGGRGAMTERRDSLVQMEYMYASGLEAITFNPAAVSNLTIKMHNLGNPGKVTNYITLSKSYQFLGMRVQGDPLNAIQNKCGLNVPGLKIPIYSTGNNPRELHSIGNILKNIYKSYVPVI